MFSQAMISTLKISKIFLECENNKLLLRQVKFCRQYMCKNTKIQDDKNTYTGFDFLMRTPC